MNTTDPPVTTTTFRPWTISTVLALLAGAIAPVLVAIALLVSLARHRPLGARYLEPLPPEGASPDIARRITLIWGIGLLLIGALQAMFSTMSGLSLLDPFNIVARILGALALETALLTGTTLYLRHRRSAQP